MTGGTTARWLFFGLLMGVLIGAAIALLLAPARGEEARRLVRSRAEPAVGRIRDMATRLAKANGGVPEEDEAT